MNAPVAVIVDALRTPIGKHRGGLSTVRPDDLAAGLLSALLDRNLPAKEKVEEVVLGATNQAGEDNRNVARMAALLADLPFGVTGVTVNRLCGSGLEAVIQVARAIRCGDLEVAVAGGVESMSRAPYAMAKGEEALPRTPPAVYDTSLGWRFPNPRMEARFPLQSMGETAENVADRFRVSREDQDAFAAESHRRAATAWKEGAFDREVVPVVVPPKTKRDKETTVAADESVRADSSPEILAKLRPVFRDGGTVTAGNSSPLNDGAAALVMASEGWARAAGAPAPRARIVASGVAGVEPNYMGIGPIAATRRALTRARMTVEDLDLIELNEAFAAQSLACVRELELDPTRVNVHGGAIALGHPIGASGARIVATLVHALHRHDKAVGLATLCIGVGQGLALVIERCDP